MTIAIANDEAFNFIYKANVDALAQLCRVVYFSPLRDRMLPPCDELYLPGGYPELFADRLEANESMRRSIYGYSEDGGRVFAECGGFMYLCRDIDGRAMCGVLPLRATMRNARLHLGYRQMTVGNTVVRGHEFHYSSVCEEQPQAGLRRLCLQRSARGKAVDTPLYRYKNVLAGYTHWYWAETTLEALWKL